ncbi:uncharacterized protein LOC131875891 [Cryptomeria japonica]|uniref:uncharacterized protein LOC131875891 n=1 Tax=Cryptomeria japonica TaxID=3369 RepID=UPI0027DA56CF|nr:uncharacterized protein LOC131875891 [Cryptomeria japonica]
MNAIRGPGDEIENEVLVKKILRSLTHKCDTKVSAIEEAKDLKTFTVDELFGSLTAYDMRTTSEIFSRKEDAFNTTKKGKEVVSHEESSEDSDAKVANFVRKLKRRSGRYKGKLPLKCFSCGKGNLILEAYTDVDWVGYIDDRKSTSGGAFFLGDRLLSWHSKKQDLVSLSVTEAKYIVAATCCSQVL